MTRLPGPGAAALGLAMAALAGACLAEASDSPHPLTLSRAVALALEQEPTVEAARARRAAAEAEAALAQSARRPSLSLSAATTYHQEPMVVTPIHGFTPGIAPEFDDTLIQGGVSASYQLYEGGARQARIDRGRSLATAAEAGVGDREQALVLATTASYLEILGLAEVLQAHQARLTALAAEQSRVQQLFGVGRAAEVDLRRIEAAIAAAEAERVRLDATLDVAERRLARLVGLDAEATRAERLRELGLPSDEPLSRQQHVARALAAHPDVARARAELAAAQAAVGLAESGRRPRLRLEGSWLDFGSAEGDFTAEWQLGVRIGLPLLDGGATRQRIAGAEAARIATAAELRLAERQVEDALDRALARLRESRAQAVSLETAVDRFAEVSRIERLRLDTGVGTQTDFLAAEAELLQARAGLVQARLGTIGARLELGRVTGELDAEWIATHLEENP